MGFLIIAGDGEEGVGGGVFVAGVPLACWFGGRSDGRSISHAGQVNAAPAPTTAGGGCGGRGGRVSRLWRFGRF